MNKAEIRSSVTQTVYTSLGVGTLTKIAHAIVAGATLPPIHYEQPAVELEFVGTVVAKERPRLGPNGHVYTSEKTMHFEREVASLGRNYMRANRRALLNCPLVVHMNVRIAVPGSWDLTKKACASALAPPSKDLDNIVKAVLDGLNGIVYTDDSQIVQLFATKRYVDGTKPPGFSLNVEPCGLVQSDIETIAKVVRQIKRTVGESGR